MSRIGRKGWNSIRDFLKEKDGYEDEKVWERIKMFYIPKLSLKGTEDTIRIMSKKYPDMFSYLEEDLNARLLFYNGKELEPGTIKYYCFKYGNFTIMYTHADVGIEPETRELLREKYGGFSYGGRYTEIDEYRQGSHLMFRCNDMEDLGYRKSDMRDITIIRAGE